MRRKSLLMILALVCICSVLVCSCGKEKNDTKEETAASGSTTTEESTETATDESVKTPDTSGSTTIQESAETTTDVTSDDFDSMFADTDSTGNGSAESGSQGSGDADNDSNNADCDVTDSDFEVIEDTSTGYGPLQQLQSIKVILFQPSYAGRLKKAIYLLRSEDTTGAGRLRVSCIQSCTSRDEKEKTDER